ncbi:MAG TPA: PAS domain S-box protein [Thermoanaerobaculaceae bacterium]|nr:PAS domain S-box protein [Thermoanaerobaculaceae bacterium]
MSTGVWTVSLALTATVLTARLAVQFGSAGSPASESANHLFDAGMPILVGAAMIWVARRSGPLRSRRAEPWWLLAFAYLCFGAGEIGFAVFGVGLDQGLPSYVLSFVYALFYVLFLVGTLRLPAAPLAARDRVKLLLDTGIVLFAAGLVEWMFLLAPLLQRSGAARFPMIATVVFQVGDLMVLWALIELLLRRREPATQPVYTLLALAAAFLIVADVAWARRILTLDTTFDAFIGPGWAVGHLVAGLAAIRSLLPSVRRPPAAEPAGGPLESQASLYVAYASGVCAFIVVVFNHLRYMTLTGAVLAAGIVALIAARHILALRENRELYERLRTAHDELEAKVRERTAELNAANVDLQNEVAERARAEEELQRRLRELILLSAVAEIAVEAESEESLVARATLAIRGTLFPDNCGVMLVDEAEGVLRRAASFHTDVDRSAQRDIRLGEGVTGRVALSGVARRVPDTSAEPGYVAGDPTMRSELCVPLRVGERTIGVVDVESRQENAFTEDDERALGTVASQIATAMERLRAAESLRLSEQNYREVFNATSEAIFVHDAATGAILDVNQTMLDLYGYTREEALGLGVAELSAQREPFTQDAAGAYIRKAIGEGPQVFEWLARRKDGSEFWVEVTLRSSLIGGKGRVLAVVRDISERKRAEEALRLSEDRFRTMVQQSYEFLVVLDARGAITYASPRAGRALGYGEDGLVGRNAFELVHHEDLQPMREAFGRTAAGRGTGLPIEFRVRRVDGSYLYLEGIGTNQIPHPSIQGIVLNARDVTERKRAEADVRRRLKELTVLNAVGELAVQAEDEEFLIARATDIVREALYPEDCGVLLVDREAGVLRYTPSYRQGVAGLSREPIPLGSGITGSVASTGAPRREGDVTRVAEYIARRPGMRSELCVPMKIGMRVVGVLNAESDRPGAFSEHDEAVLATIAGELATAIGRLRARAAQRESEERFRRLADAAFEGIGITEQGRIVDANRRLAEIFGYEPHELLGRDVMSFVAAESAGQVAGFLREAKDELYEHLAVRKDGTVFPVETQGRPIAGSGTIRVAAVRDITERKRAEQRIRRQLERLAALRAIDSAITGGMDLSGTLDLFLSHLLAQLRVDAADILRFEPGSGALAFAAGKGFRSDAVRSSRLALGECHAGRAALERRRIDVPDLAAEPNGFTRSSLLAAEEFRAYFAAPLVAKGHVHGVLEVFGRGLLDPDAEWLDYLDTLAGQLAIAIDNRTLFDDLQRSNVELAQAYDTTLEGWSKALELRDRETHGHTSRVVGLTVRLASEMGLPPEDLVHVRRGALLHDIGKMAIPDSILLKPGPLTGDEWEVMRQHPKFAFDLLAPIGFLKPALAIPYSHHEHWDGGGYPQGLAGEGIPLAARIFSVVDAWDALRYDRPYRQAWSSDEVRTYLQGEAGRRFDPQVVEAFLRISE